MRPFVVGCRKHPSQGGDTGSNPVGTAKALTATRPSASDYAKISRSTKVEVVRVEVWLGPPAGRRQEPPGGDGGRRSVRVRVLGNAAQEVEVVDQPAE